MSTFVLVHGAFSGGWCWRYLIRELAGHTVHAPTLTGLGDRARELSRDVGLDTHTADVVGLIQKHDLRDVVLVGHSYGSIVVTSAADQVPERIGQLVYLDTFVPANGEAVADIMPEWVDSFAENSPDGIRVPVPVAADAQEYHGVTEQPDLGWVLGSLTPHPLRTLCQPLRLKNPAALGGIPRAHIYCSGGGEEFQRLRQTVLTRTLPPEGEPTRELATGHDCMITMPERLGQILVELAGGRSDWPGAPRKSA